MMKMSRKRIAVISGIGFAVAIAAFFTLVWGIWLWQGSWFVTGEQYVTTSVERAQAQTPFTIVLPSYLPDGVLPKPTFIGILKELQKEPVTDVKVGYRAADLSKFVEIDETNGNMVIGDARSKIVEVKGVPVAIEEGTYSIIPKEEDNPRRELQVWWTYNGVYFHALFSGIPQSEVEKIIGSMLK